MLKNKTPIIPDVDLSDPSSDDFEALSRDRVPVRTMVESDLKSIVAIDKKITGRDRTAYYKRKVNEVLKESGVRVSLVAEVDGEFAGFIMARVDFGEFGRTAATAIIDTLGVSTGFARKNVGKALVSQLLANLASLQVEKVRTEVEWNDFGLSTFLDRCGFRPSQRLSFSRRVA
jgi:ribosomal protein S18 acetylase RimI-like enzyme